MSKNHWLVKQEPSDYSWTQFAQDGGTAWTGVRNFAARIHLRGMRRGDEVLFYHSGEEKQIVGLARVVKSAYPDPTAEEGDWSAVDLAPVKPLPNPVALTTIKQEKALSDLGLVRQSRLSVMPVTPEQWARLLALAA